MNSERQRQHRTSTERGVARIEQLTQMIRDDVQQGQVEPSHTVPIVLLVVDHQSLIEIVCRENRSEHVYRSMMKPRRTRTSTATDRPRAFDDGRLPVRQRVLQVLENDADQVVLLPVVVGQVGLLDRHRLLLMTRVRMHMMIRRRVRVHTAHARRWRRRHARQKRQIERDEMLVRTNDTNEIELERDVERDVGQLAMSDFKIELNIRRENDVERTDGDDALLCSRS
jgi:hypothetical protein